MTETLTTSSRPATAAAALLRRWPVALAVALGVAMWGIDAARAGQILTVLPAVYVVVAVLRRRSASWPVLVVSLAVLVLLQLQTLVQPTIGMVALATAVAVVGLRRRPGRPELAFQFVGLLAFGGLALTGLVLAPDVARYILAAAWFGHGVWDLVHLRRDAVVSRSYAEWCGVVDLLVAGGLLVAG